jgi:hypothetical protein
MMNRRAFVTGLGAALATSPAVEAQQMKQIPRVGVCWVVNRPRVRLRSWRFARG